MSEPSEETTPKERERGLHFLEQMLRIRRFEERCAQLYSEQKIRGFLHLYIGQEAVAAGVLEEVDEREAVVATYREHAHALLKGLSAECIMAEMYGKQEGCSRGRGGSMHLFSADRRLYGGNAIVGGGLPLAVGLGLADQMGGEERATVCFFGEGAVAEGEFHEAMNLAALWELPVLFCCENNRYAMGTALDRSESQKDIHLKAASYNLEARQVDGMDVIEVNRAARRALERIRRGEGPQFLECLTYRFRAHSMFDAELYRPKQEVEQWKERGPIRRLTEQMEEAGMLEESDLEEIDERVGREVERAVAFAEEGTWEPVEELTRFVYSEEGDDE
jgi:pyruvate dehydrogenase E1 component alpha subunit